MTSAPEPQGEGPALPPFHVRWRMLFRRYPSSLLDFGLLSGVLFRRGTVFWENFLAAERRRREREAEPARQPQVPQRGAWRVED